MTTTYYFGKVLDGSLLTTANDVSTASGATASGQDTPIGTLTGYGELCPNSAPGTWPAYGSESTVPFSSKGQIYPTSLVGQAFLDGTWTATLRCSVAGTSPSSITADLIVRVWVWNSSTLAKTKYGVCTLAAQTITTTSTTFTFGGTSLPAIAFGSNDYLYFDTLANVTSNPNGSGVGAKIRCNFSTSSSQGSTTSQVVAPNLVAARIVPATAALLATLTRTVPATAALAMQRTVPATVSLSGPAHRIVPATASLCRGPLAVPYVPPVADTHYVTASGGNLVYRGKNIKLYGATIYLSTQGGAATWLNGDASAVIDDLFHQAYLNGLSMIRITDFWDGGHISGLDSPQLWANIDHCVTRAAQYGMFVMMDVSAYKNVLVAGSIDYTVAANWYDWLTFVGMHYRNTAPSICWYNILGEPSVPVDQASATALGAFYETLCSTLNAADNSTHLIEAAGLTHMNQAVAGLTDPAWWYAIYTAPHNNICGYKTYSVNDLAYLSTVRSIMNAHSINKPLANNEFGAQQEQGDQFFPVFANTLATGITASATVTALSLNTTITQTVVAGTIIAVSATENFVVATDTSSGTSLPVNSVTASSNHSIGDSVAALGFADVGHSLGDTVYGYYSAVLGLTTTINKWNNTPRTFVPTSVMGGDQAGTVSYVVWNLGYQLQAAGYDVSANQGTSPISWLLFGKKSRTDGYQPLYPYPPLTITIAGQSVIFDEDSFTISYKQNERWRCQFTMLDYTGLLPAFDYMDAVQIVDANLGPLFTGYVIDDILDKSNTLTSGATEHKIDCVGKEMAADQQTSDRLYTVPTPAGQVVLDALKDALTAEGIIAYYASLESSAASDWATYTLSGTAGTSNLPGGDLELAPAGSTLTISESTTSDFAAGTLTNVQATNNTLTLQSYTGISMTASCIGNVGNAFLYWQIDGTNRLQTNNWLLEYTIWIDPSSTHIQGSVDVVYTDGSTLRDTFGSGSGQLDQHGINCHPSTDLSGWANGQWFYRRLGLYPFTGKTINYVSMAFESNDAGNYGMYLHDVKLTYLGSTIVDLSGNFTGGSQISNNGYTNIKIGSQFNVYAQSGTRISSSHSTASVGIYQTSLASWIVALPTTITSTFALSTSFDGGATWQAATNRTALGIIAAGTSLSARSVLIREDLAITGNTPTASPILSQVALSLVPSYTATLHDVLYTRTSAADFNAGTLTNLIATSAGLGLNGFWRDWAQSDINTLASDQTVYGTASPSQALFYNELKVQSNTGADARIRMDGAGNTWQNFTLSVIIQIPTSGNGSIGVVYRTTNWGNANDSYAYVITVSSTLIQLGHGTNSTGAGSFTNIATAGVTLTVGNFYTLKVIVSGNSHMAYLDNVQYLSATDSTYTAAGYIGMRLYNGTGAALTGYFGSLGIVASLTGQYVSDTLSLNAVGTVGASRIFWQDVAPGSSTIVFETSINGGSTWQTATYGQAITGLSGGTSVVGVNLLLRITITAGSVTDQPIVTGISAWVTTQYSSSGSAITPSLSLAPVGQVGSTLAAWAGLRPTNTTIFADTSIDGGTTWTSNVAPAVLAVAGSTQYAGTGAIGGITTQPDPTVDAFATDSSASYSAGHQTGGSDGTWSYTATTGRLTVTGGNHAIFKRNSITGINVDLLCDMDLSDAGGLLFCRSDASNAYTVVVCDNQSAVGTPNTITLYRNGVSVGSAPISFHRGLFYRIRATIYSGVITVSFDGATMITYTDGSPLVTGGHGLFSNGGTARFSLLWLQPTGDNVTTISVLTRLRLTSTDPTATPQIQSLTVSATGPQISPGTTIPSADYRDKFHNKNLDDAAKQSNYAWHVDANSLLYFNAGQARPAPWILQSNTLGLPSDLELDNNLAVETLGDLYRNRQKLTGVTNSAIFQDSFVGNGLATSFTLRYPVAEGTFPTITLNSGKQSAGLKGTSGSNWYYAAGDPTLAQDTTTALPLTTGDTLIVSYTGTFTDTVVVNNTSAQTALALKTGGSGIVEAVEDVSSRNMTYAAAVVYANQLLTRYCITGRLVNFVTYRNGLAVGQLLVAQVPEEKLYMAQLAIHQIDLTLRTQPGNTVLYRYVVQASELPRVASFAKLVATNLLT